MNCVENLQKKGVRARSRGGREENEPVIIALVSAGVNSTLVNRLKPSPKPNNLKLARTQGAMQAIGGQMQLYCWNGILTWGPWSQV